MECSWMLVYMYMSTIILADTPADKYRSSVDRQIAQHVDWYGDQESVDMSANISTK